MSTVKERIEQANAEVFRRITAADPVLVDVAPAHEVIPRLAGDGKVVLHSGPPVTWPRMCGAQKGAAIGMALFEGWSKTPDQAQALFETGEVVLEPNHHHGAVGPMAGTITASLPVFVVKNRGYGNRAYCRPVESRQQFGDYGPEALRTLATWRGVWGPALRNALRSMGGVPLKPLISRALEMGDELHNRQIAASSLFANAMTIPLLECGLPKEQALSTLRLLGNHPVFFLGLAMASAKAATDAARGVEYSTVVTAMARNGTEFGIQVSGLDGEWFSAPAPPVDGLMLPGYAARDAGLDMGDSAITEVVGWGGFALGGAPGILSLVGGTVDQALTVTRDMREITVGESRDYRIPALDFRGAAVGIDVRKVLQKNILPVIDTAIAHREPGHPIIGAGWVRPPVACFQQALVSFAHRYQVER